MKTSLIAALVAVTVVATIQPVAAVPHVPAYYCGQDLYWPTTDMADCAAGMKDADWSQAVPPANVANMLLFPQEGDFCASQGNPDMMKAVRSENKWTPLYGSNSPMQGTGEFIAESAHAGELDISLGFRGSKASLSQAETLNQGASVTAENGQSRVIFQYITWTEYERMYCGWDFTWHRAPNLLAPTDYEPNGSFQQEAGELEGPSTNTDWDNIMYPTGFQQSNTIGIDISFWQKEDYYCPKTTKTARWFGEEGVCTASLRITFNGVAEIGGAYVTTESSTYRYQFNGGCYWIDRLGDGDVVGWAFHPTPYRYPNGECKPNYERECKEEKHNEPADDGQGLQACNEPGSTPLGSKVTPVCSPARPTPCEVLGGSLSEVLVDVNALQQAWLQQADPTPESKADLLKTLCEGGKPIECGDVCQTDPCAEVASLGNGDVCATVAGLVPQACQYVGGLCEPGSLVCSGDEATTTGNATTPACDPDWSAYDACDWDATADLQGNPARDFACDGDYPEPEPVCTYVEGTVACPPACQGTCATIMEAVAQANPCNEQAPPGTEYALDVACGREDFDACELGNGVEETYLCGGSLPVPR
jgi:hypothetical protein